MSNVLLRILYKPLLRRAKYLDNHLNLKIVYQGRNNFKFTGSCVEELRNAFKREHSPSQQVAAVSDCFRLYNQSNDLFRLGSFVTKVARTQKKTTPSPLPTSALPTLDPEQSLPVTSSPSTESEQVEPQREASILPKSLPILYQQFHGFPGGTFEFKITDPSQMKTLDKIADQLPMQFGFLTEICIETAAVGIVGMVEDIRKTESGYIIRSTFGERFILSGLILPDPEKNIPLGNCEPFPELKISPEDESQLKTELLDNAEKWVNLIHKDALSMIEKDFGKKPTSAQSLEDISWWMLNVFHKEGLLSSEKMEIFRSNDIHYRIDCIRKVMNYFLQIK
eukprot:TRINITY_DN3401_c0_g1_i1.p1 TRINITY_DN3401_c0_g1~~TRINITY_DN3401_c0_g1_i1.p1  ORF type:complete len:337 (-),score=60.76 TRINITY_DN3401_c0_g1_i1:128-1138(-)